MSTLKIQERFVSIQGEGVLVGMPSSFVRVSGCNLRCTWCDTPLSSWAPEGEQVEVAQLAAWCAQGPRHVVLTGGEPMLFSAAAELSRELRRAGRHLTVETAGTSWCEGLEADLLSISPKLAHSTPWQRAAKAGTTRLATMHERARIDLDVLERLLAAYPWQLKFVVRPAPEQLTADLDEIEQLLADLKVSTRDRERVLLMPEAITSDAVREGYLAVIDTCRTRGFRLGQRLHIYMFGHTPGT